MPLYEIEHFKSKTHWIILFATILSSTLLHWNIFNKDLIGVHLWRQAQNEWYTRNFLRNDNSIFNPRIAAHNLGSDGNILRYEFPLLQWSTAQVKRVFGDSIFITRLIMFGIGIATVMGFYFFIQSLFGNKMIASLAAFSFMYSPVFYYYSINPLSDVCALGASCWMFFYLIRYTYLGRTSDFLISSLLLMMAGLFKLPYFMFGIMPLTLIGFKLINKSISSRKLVKEISILFQISIPVAAWYIYAISSWGYMGVLKGVTAHTNFSELWIYLKFALFQWLPKHLINPFGLIFFLIGLLVLMRRQNFEPPVRHILISGFLITVLYYVYEINMIAKVHDYYMLPFLPWLHVVMVMGIQWIFNTHKYSWLLIPFLLAMPVFSYFKIDTFWNINRNGYNADWFNHSVELKAAVPRDSLCIILNDNSGVVMPYVIDKQGYVFDKNELPAMWVEDMILRRRATYMYSDSRQVDTSVEMRKYLDSMMMEKGSVRVFKLIGQEKVEMVK
jgi:hypothetical protein